jgi:hypothetical protein
MSRVLLLQLTEDEAAKGCVTHDVEVSVIEPLESGGVRVVCASSGGAALLRHKMRTKLIDGPVTRSRIFAKGMQPFATSLAPQEKPPRPGAPRVRNDRW